MESFKLDNRSNSAFKFSTDSLNSAGKAKSNKSLFSKRELLTVETEVRPKTIGKQVRSESEAREITDSSAKKIGGGEDSALSTHDRIEVEKVFELLV